MVSTVPQCGRRRGGLHRGRGGGQPGRAQQRRAARAHTAPLAAGQQQQQQGGRMGSYNFVILGCSSVTDDHVLILAMPYNIRIGGTV